MTGKGGIICATCAEVLKSTSKFDTCGQCLQNYHLACSKVTTVRNSDNTLVKLCAGCLVVATSPATVQKTKSGSRAISPLTTRSRTGSQSSTSSLSNSEALSHASTAGSVTADFMARVMDSLKKLDKLESIERSVTNMSSRITSLEDRVTGLEPTMSKVNSALTHLECLPVIEQRFDSNDERLKRLELEHRALKDACDLACRGSAKQRHAESSVRLKQLEAQKTALSSQLQHLATQHKRLEYSADLVVSGLAYSNVSDLKLLAFAAISAVHRDIILDDVVEVKVMQTRRAHTTAPSTSTVTDVCATAVDTTATSTATTYPLLVTLANPTLARVVITSKIRHKKLLLSQLNADDLRAAAVPLPVPVSTVNMNEYLPAETHRLKRLVLAKAKDREHDFLTFVRNGIIYARKKRS